MRSSLQSLLEWLNVEMRDEALFEKLESQKQTNKGHDRNYDIQGCDVASPVMRDDTKAMLERFYEPWNEMLSMQLGREMWQYT
jgi:hypothetical protein